MKLFLISLKIRIINPAIPLLGVCVCVCVCVHYPRSLKHSKILVHKHNSPLDGIKNAIRGCMCTWITYAVQHYSAIKRKGVLTRATVWMNLKTLRWVKEASHKRPYSVWFHLRNMSRISKFREAESRLMFLRDWKKVVTESNCLTGPGCPFPVIFVTVE